jgi:hypothetical protein
MCAMIEQAGNRSRGVHVCAPTSRSPWTNHGNAHIYPLAHEQAKHSGDVFTVRLGVRKWSNTGGVALQTGVLVQQDAPVKAQ